MCGIGGISGQFNINDLHASRLALAHRGPDDSGWFVEPTYNVGLTHTRLSILDLSPLGHQPMVSPDGRFVIVFNGEIYNFRELRAALEARGVQFRGSSDTEVLLQLYIAEREDPARMLRSLNGIFAFALWDSSKQMLLVARDALGVKPLYYCSEGQSFAFASEIKALLPLIQRRGQLDLVAIHHYLSLLWSPGERTPLEAVRKLGPGEALWVQDGAIVNRLTWYRLPVFCPQPLIHDVPEVIQQLTTKLRRAVHRQLVADVPVGAFLSGGLDSSSVVAFAREQNADIRCFTIDSGGGNSGEGFVDDLPYARRVAKHLGVSLEIVPIDSVRMAQDLEAMVVQLDEPLADPAPLNVLYISRLAREHGLKVLLSGAGGDDLFTGYRRHRALMLDRRWNWLPQPVRAIAEQFGQMLDNRHASARRLRKLLDGIALSGDDRLVNFFLWAKRSDLLQLYTADFRAALGSAAAEAPMRAFLAEMPPTVHPLERMLALEQRFFLADHNLTYTDKMSMAAGVEVRVPFLDLDLVEFASRIPPELKQRGSVGKWVLKKAMEPLLPKDVIYRPKSGFGAPLRRWMRVELRPMLGDLLSETSLRRRALFDAVAVHKLIAANDVGKVDASYTLLSLLCIEIWCRHFIDQPSIPVSRSPEQGSVSSVLA